MSKDFINEGREGVFNQFEKLGENGIEYIYKFDRDKTRNAILGIELIKKNLIFVENSGGFFEIANRKKAEFLGVVYYHKAWKKFVWEQEKDTILAANCGKELFDWIGTLKEDSD